jgi:hypothetical protein
MNRFSFWQTWLWVLSVVIAMLGVALALWGGTPLFDWMNNLINPIFWGTQLPGVEASAFRQWMYAVLGAVMAGWGIFLAFIARYPFARRERWAWDCTIIGLLVWFLIDTSASLYFKVYFNVIGNTGLLVLALLPLIFTRKQFARPASDGARIVE